MILTRISNHSVTRILFVFNSNADILYQQARTIVWVDFMGMACAVLKCADRDAHACGN